MLEKYYYDKNDKYNIYESEDLKVRKIISKPTIVSKVSYNVFLLIFCTYLYKYVLIQRSYFESSYSIQYFGKYGKEVIIIGGLYFIISIVGTVINNTISSIKVFILTTHIEESLMGVYKKELTKKWTNIILQTILTIALINYTITSLENLQRGNEFWGNIAIITLVIKVILRSIHLLINRFRLKGIEEEFSIRVKTIEGGSSEERKRIMNDLETIFSRYTVGKEKETELIWGTLYENLIIELDKLLKKVKEVADEEKDILYDKSNLITNLSHDLKTPLTSIINSIYILENDKELTQIEKQEQIEILISKLNRLDTLIENLNNVIESEEDILKVNFEKLNLVDLLRESIESHRNKLKNLNLDIRESLPGEKVEVYIDKEHTIRILENIFSNIEKYSLEGTRVYISIEKSDESVDILFRNISKYEIEVDKKTIGNRFVKGDKSRHIEGNGLGLNIVKSLMRVQGGKVDIDIKGDLFKVALKFNNS